MQFFLIDRITAMNAEFALGCKSVSQTEEYLHEHFRTTPVLPGVMEIEGLTQLAGWWLRCQHHFEDSQIATLRKLQNVKYGRFVHPGEKVLYRVTFRKQEGPFYVFDAVAEIDCSDVTSPPQAPSNDSPSVPMESARPREKIVSAKLTIESQMPNDPEVATAMRQRLQNFYEHCLWRDPTESDK
ncbi:MAG: hypothetical protein PHE53_05770 [Thermoguttaceae bacterium]|nr:hypothetical protein [Thermoguttaceae bacterium]